MNTNKDLNKDFTLFKSSDIDKLEASQRPKCCSCGLFKKCVSPKMDYAGKGERGVLIVSSGVSEEQDEKGRWNGSAEYMFLYKELRRIGIDIVQDCWYMSALSCYSSSYTEKQIQCCRPKVMQAIYQLKPKLIVLSGMDAVRSVVGKNWKKQIGSIHKWRGWLIPDQELKTYILPVFDVNVVSEENVNQALITVFRKDLNRILEVGEKVNVVDYNSMTKEIFKKREVETFLKSLNQNKPSDFAWDIETEMLKPHSKKVKFYTCSIAYRENGNLMSYSFPVYNDIVPLLLTLLQDDDIGKIAHNMKFEHLWAVSSYLLHVSPWIWDTQLTAHVLDNRTASTSLKFQTYVNFGVPDYDSSISSYLESEGSYTPNRIKELNIADVLKYNALDSLFTYLLYEKQKEQVYG
jgi:uracil-DNA glycosylase